MSSILSKEQLRARGISPTQYQGDRNGSTDLLKLAGSVTPSKTKEERLISPRLHQESQDDCQSIDAELTGITHSAPLTTAVGASSSLAPESAQPQPERIKGSVQIVDGLFIGDRQSSIDGQYIRSNQICRIINTVSSQMKNIFDPAEMSNAKIREFIQKKPPSFKKLVGQVQYLDFDWCEKLTVPKVFQEVEAHRQARQKIYQFIEMAIENHRSVLILSETNQFRSVIIAAFYIMKQYRWTTARTLEFILSKKEDIQITKEMLRALQAIEKDLDSEHSEQPFLQEWASIEQAQRSQERSSGDLRHLEEVSLVNSFMNSIYLHGSQTQAQIDSKVLESSRKGKAQQKQEQAPDIDQPKSMTQIIQESRYEQARTSLQTRRSVNWNDSVGHELFGEVNEDDDDEEEGRRSSSPPKFEKMGAIQEKKRQYEQLKLDQRQIRMFQVTHFAREKPNAEVEQQEQEKQEEDEEGSKNGGTLTVVNEQTAEQNDTRSQVSGSRQPEQDGDFISKEMAGSELTEGDEDGRLDSQDQAWALKEKKIKNKQSQRFCKALQEEQLILSKTKASKQSGPQPTLTLAQAQQQAALIPPTGKGTRQSFVARERRLESQGKTGAPSHFTLREKTQLKQASKEMDEPSSKLSVYKKSAEAKHQKVSKRSSSAASTGSNPGKVMENPNKDQAGKNMEKKSPYLAPELHSRKTPAPTDQAERQPSQSAQSRRQSQQVKPSTAIPLSANSESRASKRIDSNMSHGSQRSSEAIHKVETGSKDVVEQKAANDSKKRSGQSQNTKLNTKQEKAVQQAVAVSTTSNPNLVLSAPDSKPSSRQSERPLVQQQNESTKKSASQSQQGSEQREQEKDHKIEVRALPSNRGGLQRNVQNQAIAKQIDGKVKNIMRQSQAVRGLQISSGSSLPNINGPGGPAQDPCMQSMSTIQTSDRNVHTQNLIRPRNDQFEISSSEQSQQSCGISQNFILGNGRFSQKKFQPAGIQAQSLDNVAIPSKDSALKFRANESKLHKGSLDADMPLHSREKSFNQALRQASSELSSIARVVSTRDSSQGADARKPGGQAEKAGASAAQPSRFQQSIEAHAHLQLKKTAPSSSHVGEQPTKQMEIGASDATHLVHLNQIQMRPTTQNPIKKMKSLRDNKEESNDYKQAAPATLQKRVPLQLDPQLVLAPSLGDEVLESAWKLSGALPPSREATLRRDGAADPKAAELQQIYASSVVGGGAKRRVRADLSDKKAASIDAFSEFRKEKYLKNIKSYQKLNSPEYASIGAAGTAPSSDIVAHSSETSGKASELKQREPRKPDLLALPALNLQSISSQPRLKSGRKSRKKSARQRKPKSSMASTRTDRVHAIRERTLSSRSKLRTSSANPKPLQKHQQKNSRQDGRSSLGMLEAHAIKTTVRGKKQSIDIMMGKKPNRDLSVVPDLREGASGRPELLERPGSDFKQAQAMLKRPFDSKDPYGLRPSSGLAPLKMDVSFVGRQKSIYGTQGHFIKFSEPASRRVGLLKKSSLSEQRMGLRSPGGQGRGTSAKERHTQLYDPKRTQRNREYIQQFRSSKAGASPSTNSTYGT